MCSCWSGRGGAGHDRRGESSRQESQAFPSNPFQSDPIRFHHKVPTNIEYHSVCPLVGIGTLKPPLSPGVCPFPQNQRGRVHCTHTRLRVTGWGSPNSDTWRKAEHYSVVFIHRNLLHSLSSVPTFIQKKGNVFCKGGSTYICHWTINYSVFFFLSFFFRNKTFKYCTATTVLLSGTY